MTKVRHNTLALDRAVRVLYQHNCTLCTCNYVAFLVLTQKLHAMPFWYSHRNCMPCVRDVQGKDALSLNAGTAIQVDVFMGILALQLR